MQVQKSLFELPQRAVDGHDVPSSDRFEGAVMFSAIGDALGWPTEFVRPDADRKPPFALPIRSFVPWRKLVGGRWWGYPDDIAPGQYSDDTQLSLAVARSISPTGEFEPETFAYSELPLWLHYERGGGRSIKAAARSLIRRKLEWFNNFYKSGDVDYCLAGANGAAMRTLPIALANAANAERLVRDVFHNAIITHGHPRAILGAELYGLAVNHVLRNGHETLNSMPDYLGDSIQQVNLCLTTDARIAEWVESWDAHRKKGQGQFKKEVSETMDELHHYLDQLPDFLQRRDTDYYRFVGALAPETKGSGLSTVCAALFTFLMRPDEPEACVLDAVNLLGSDTDTIASFVGGLLGACHGSACIPSHLAEGLQDRDYLTKVARRLHGAAGGGMSERMLGQRSGGHTEAFLRILAWELGLHEMFWDAIGVGGMVTHPALGRGKITRKEVRPIHREGFVANLIHIVFDCGQTCVFHSRVDDNGRVSESMAQDVDKALSRDRR